MKSCSTGNSAFDLASKTIEKVSIKNQREKELEEKEDNMDELIKEMAKAVGVKITKKVFADSIGKSIPVIASIISGALTYHNFGSGADKLHESLREKPYK